MILKNKYVKYILVLLGSLISEALLGANKVENKKAYVLESKAFKPIVAFDTYVTLSTGEAKYGDRYTSRFDVEFRRMRFGASGSLVDRFKYSFQLYLDRLGKDEYSSVKGSYSGVNIWNAYLSYQVLKKSLLLNLHVGYFWAATSREFNTSPWAIGSFDKVRATWYLRQFSTGKGNGVESGLGIGGLTNFKNWGINYRIGTYETATYNNVDFVSRLYAGRVAFTIGDPEQKKYKYMLAGNQWRKRNGITIGLGGSSQNNGLLNSGIYFSKSLTYGADILIDYKGFRFDAEYFILERTAIGLNDYMGNEWHIRFGYMFPVQNKLLEPTLTYDSYEGRGNSNLYEFIGYDHTIDIGVNYYLNRDKLKLTLHYLIQEGTVSSNIGDYLGMSCIYRL